MFGVYRICITQRQTNTGSINRLSTVDRHLSDACTRRLISLTWLPLSPPGFPAPDPECMNNATPVTIRPTLTYFFSGYFFPRNAPISITGIGLQLFPRTYDTKPRQDNKVAEGGGGCYALARHRGGGSRGAGEREGGGKEYY